MSVDVESVLKGRVSHNRIIIIQRNLDQLVTIAGLIRQDKKALAGFSILSLFTALAIFAPLIAPYDPNAIAGTERVASPSFEHPLGTTSMARDVLSQLIYGARVSLLVAFVSGFAVMVIGTTIGLIAGYYKGTVDLVLMRVVDIVYGIPATPLILVLVLFLGASIWNIILAMVLVMWRTTARIVRSETLSLSEKPFVKAARATGASNFRIMYFHIAPNLLPLILVEATIVMGYAVILEAGISFLGLSGADTVSWGTMLEATFATGAIRFAWWWVIPPGIALTLLVLSFFYISRAIEEITSAGGDR